MSVNKVILIGKVGQTSEIRNSGTGPVVNFQVETRETWKDKSGAPQERVEHHKIVAWGSQAEFCNKYLGRGSQVYIEGKLQTRVYQDNFGDKKVSTEVQAQNIQFLQTRENPA